MRQDGLVRGTFLDDIRDGDVIAPERMAARLGVPLDRLSQLAQLGRDTLTSSPGSPAVQEKLGLLAVIITRAAELAGDEERALVWFKHQPIPGWNKTAEELVEEGRSAAVLEDLERMAAGVYS